MKKLTALLLAAALCLGTLAACGGKEAATTPVPNDPVQSAEANTPAPVKKDPSEMTLEELKPLLKTVTDGKLTVATSPDFAPYEFYAIGADGTPTLAGFDMALAQYVADFLGLELEVIPIDFYGVLMEVQTKSVDMGMAGLSPDPKRANIMDFSEIYYLGGQSFCCTEANKDKFPDLASTNKSEYQIGAQTGSIQVDLMQTNSPDCQQIQLAKVTDIIAELLAGKLDGAYIETAVAQSYKVNYPDLCVVLEVPYEAAAGSAVGVQKDNPVLLAAVNLAIKQALADGSMDKFVAEANEKAAGETASLVGGEIVKDEK